MLYYNEMHKNNESNLLTNRNCSEPTSKMLRISSVWRIRQIKFQKQA